MSQYCYWCGSSNLIFYKIIHTDSLLVCTSCQLVQTKERNQRSNRKVNKEIYSEEYLTNYLIREKQLKSRFQKRVNEIDVICPGGNILDVGCSVGFFLESVGECSKHQWNLHGIDMNKQSLKIARNRLSAKLKLGTIVGANYKSNYFDCITCFDVLEHDIDLKKTLEEIRRILKPGGLLVVQSPNYTSVMAKLSGENWDWWSIPDHVIHFNKFTIEKVVQQSGLLVSCITTWEDKVDFCVNIAGNIRRTFLPAFQFHRIMAKGSLVVLPFLWRMLVPFESFLPLGGELLVYAKKPN